MKPARFLLSATVLVMLATLAPADADAQGLLRRLRERVFNPPPASSNQDASRRLPARPIPVPESGPSSDYRRPDGRQAVSPIPSTTSPGAPTPAVKPGGVQQTGATTQDRRQPGQALRDAGQFGRSILAPLGLDEKRAEQARSAASVSGGAPDPSAPATLGIKGKAANPGYPSVEVTELLPHSLAGQGGLQVGDYIFAIDSKATPTVAVLAEEVRARRPGEQVKLRIGREGRVSDLAVVLASRPGAGVSSTTGSPSGPALTNRSPAKNDPAARSIPAPQPVPAADALPTRALDGAEVSDVAGRRGVLVGEVQPGTLAASAQIQTGDRIVAVDGRMVSDRQSLGELLGSVAKDETAGIRLIRDNRLVDLTYSFDQTMAKASAEPKSGSGGDSVLGGLGSVLGGMFGQGAKQDAPASAKQADSAKAVPTPAPASPEPVAEMPEPAPSSGEADSAPVESENIQIKPFGGAKSDKKSSFQMPSLTDLLDLEPSEPQAKPEADAKKADATKAEDSEALPVPGPAKKEVSQSKESKSSQRQTLQEEIQRLQDQLKNLGGEGSE